MESETRRVREVLFVGRRGEFLVFASFFILLTRYAKNDRRSVLYELQYRWQIRAQMTQTKLVLLVTAIGVYSL